MCNQLYLPCRTKIERDAREESKKERCSWGVVGQLWVMRERSREVGGRMLWLQGDYVGIVEDELCVVATDVFGRKQSPTLLVWCGVV